METAFREIVEALAAGSAAVVDGFCDGATLDGLRVDAGRRRDAGEFQRARVGRGETAQVADAIRHDEICWWNEPDLSEPQRRLHARVDALRTALNRELFVGARSFEMHYALYAPGSFYAKHLDRFATDGARVISAVLYLDEDWRHEDGGQLVLYGDGSKEAAPRKQVVPVAGRLVCFASDRHYHEVLPTRRERRSVAMWFRRHG